MALQTDRRFVKIEGGKVTQTVHVRGDIDPADLLAAGYVELQSKEIPSAQLGKTLPELKVKP